MLERGRSLIIVCTDEPEEPHSRRCRGRRPQRVAAPSHSTHSLMHITAADLDPAAVVDRGRPQRAPTHHHHPHTLYSHIFYTTHTHARDPLERSP